MKGMPIQLAQSTEAAGSCCSGESCCSGKSEQSTKSKENNFVGTKGAVPQQAERRLFLVRGLDCADCAKHLEQRIGALEGAADVRVHFTNGTLSLIYEGSSGTILRAIRQAGYDAEEADGGKRSAAASASRSFWRGNPKVIPTLLSAVLFAVAWGYDAWFGTGEEGGFGAAAILYLLAMVAGGWRIAYTGITGLRSKTVGMELLMTLSAIGAAAIGEWSEGAAVIALFSLGEMLEAYTMDRTRRSIRGLMELAPDAATVVRDGREESVPVEAILIGDLIVVKPGERIPMDGIVTEGSSGVNQAPITGESVPVDKKAGDGVYAGSVNGEGTLVVEVSRLAKDNTIARILVMIEEAEAQKAPSQRFVDRFARIYTPVVMALAALVAIVPPLAAGQAFEPWLYRALTLLVVACPCALVISTPVAIAAAIGHAARRGVLIKGGTHLERLGNVRAIAFDKTGTLTQGVPEVVRVCAAPGSGADEAEVLRLAAAVESGSAHPLARAVLRYAESQGGAGLTDAREFRVYPGMGASAAAGGRQVYAGSPRMFRERLGVSLEPFAEALAALDREGRPYMLVGTEDTVLGWLAFADPVRSASAQALAELAAIGVRQLHMLTGDHAGAAEAAVRAMGGAARSLTWEAGLLPDEKLDRIRALNARHGVTAMVGDGINDAPALAAATVGIAMGAAGTDTALETADVALMRDDLSQLPYAIGLSRRALGIIRQNIVFSLVIKALFLAAIIPGWTTLWLAVLADTGAALAVIVNGMRLLRSSR